jgi:subtilisin family serine protease
MMDNLRRNIKFSILLFCIILGLFFVSASYEKNSNRLPLFDLEIPQPSEKMFMSSMDFDESEMKVIITLNNPDEIWKNEVSSMSSLDLKNLKTIMRLYVIDSNDLETKHKFNSFNGFSATISQQEYSGLLNNPLVKSITVDEEVSILMQDTIDLVNATSSWNLQVDGMNLTGAGQSVCVIDTGVDYTHPDLGGCDKIYDVIIDEEYLNTSITSPNFPNNYSDNFSLLLMGEITIPGADSIQVFFDEFDLEFWDTVYLGNGEGELYWMYNGDLGSFWSEEILGETISVFFMSDESINHKGFNISMARANFINSSDCDKVIGGIDYAYQSLDPMDVQGHGTHCAGTVAADGGIKGVAPDAKLVAVKSLDNTGSGRISDIIAGIEFCTENAEKYNISVISMSLGGGINYSSYCDVNLSVYSTAINNAVLNNISVVVATGNSANLTHISAPACIENAIRVGSSVKDDNALSGFSNRWLLDMLVAPGSSITSTCVGGVACAKSGTSMATPHVAGAIAILNQYSSLRNNLKTPYEINQILINSGKQINDSLTEINYSRLDIYSALMLLDEYPPLIEIYSPQDTIYNYTEILINITAEDDLSLDSIWYNWNGTNYTYTAELNITFDEGDHVLHAWANDTAGNINYTNVSFFIDSLAPEIIINTPLNISYNYSQNLLNITAYDVNLDSVWFNFNGSNVSYEESVYVDFDEGDHVLHAWANDTAGNINYTNVSFKIDTTPPYYTDIITKISYIYNATANHWFNVSLFDLSGVDTAKFYLTYPNNTIVDFVMLNDDDIWYFNISNLSYGDYSYYLWANDTVGNKDNLTKVSSFTIYENFNDTYQTEINDSNFEVPENVTLIFVETDNVLGNVTISQNNSNGINLSFINRPDNVINFANKTIFNRSINVSKNLVVEIFANTTMVVDGLWDGSFILPELIDININSSINVSLALKIGSNNNISFNQPVKVLLPGQAGKNVAWMSNGEDLNEIVILCDDPVIPNITEGSCKINSTFGDDLIVWTYHFTNFIAYEEIQDDDGSNGGSNGGSDNGGGSVTGSTVDVCISKWVCGDWGECINGYQSRTCNDQNNCNPSIPSRPEERKRCFLPSSTDDDVNFTVNFTEEIIDENHLSQDNTELNSGSEDDGLSSLSTEHTSDDEMKIDNDLEKTAYLSEIDRGKILWISMIGIFLFITVSTIFLVVKKNSYNDDFDLNFSKVQKILDNEKTSLWQKMFSLRKEKDPVYKSIIDKETYSKLYNENKNKK